MLRIKTTGELYCSENETKVSFYAGENKENYTSQILRDMFNGVQGVYPVVVRATIDEEDKSLISVDGVNVNAELWSEQADFNNYGDAA